MSCNYPSKRHNPMAGANYECKDTTKFADVQILRGKSLSFKVKETRIAFGRIDIEHAAYSTKVEEIEEYLLGGHSAKCAPMTIVSSGTPLRLEAGYPRIIFVKHPKTVISNFAAPNFRKVNVPL